MAKQLPRPLTHREIRAHQVLVQVEGRDRVSAEQGASWFLDAARGVHWGELCGFSLQW